MNKVFKELSQNLGLRFSPKQDALTGDYNGFTVVVQDYNKKGFYILKVPFTSNSERDINAILNFTNSIKSEVKDVTESTFENYCLTVKLTKGSNNSHNIVELLKIITNFTSSNGYKSCCEVCGKLKLPGFVQYNNYPMLNCLECHKTYLEDPNNREEYFMKKESNIQTCILGAFLGGLIGVLIWVISHNLGYISGARGLVLVFFIIEGHELIGGRLNKRGLIITLVISIIMVYVANYLSYALELQKSLQYSENISVLESIKDLSKYLEYYPKFNSDFSRDLALGYGFTALGAFYILYKSFKNGNIKVKTKGLEQ